MTESVLARGDLDKDAEVLDRRDGAAVNPADLDVFGQGFDPSQCGLGGRPILGGDRDRGGPAVFLDVDLGAGLVLDGPDGLATGSDQQADLLDALDARLIALDAINGRPIWVRSSRGAGSEMSARG